MKRYGITPSIGYTRLGPTIYVLAPNPAAAENTVRALNLKYGFYRPTCYPTALLSHFPANATILTAN